MAAPNFYANDLPTHATCWYREGRRYTPPHEAIIAAFLTIVAKFSDRFDVGIAGWALMGSHPHIMAFDRERDPDEPSKVWLFRQQVNACFARWLNNYWSTRGQVFSRQVKPQLIHIVDAKRTADTFGYIANNPVAAGLVMSPEDMPEGSVSLPGMLFEPVQIPRPEDWFRKKRWAEVATIQLEMPPLAVEDGHTLESWYDAISLATNQHQMACLYLLDGPVKGVEAILDETPYVPHDTERVSYGKADHAGTDKLRLARLYARERAHNRAYRRAFEALGRGEDDVVFPYGTGRMVVSYGHRMASG
jgi:hypothetical protein